MRKRYRCFPFLDKNRNKITNVESHSSELLLFCVLELKLDWSLKTRSHEKCTLVYVPYRTMQSSRPLFLSGPRFLDQSIFFLPY